MSRGDTHAEVDKILGPGGSLEAFVPAKKQGKMRHIGFTGHADPKYISACSTLRRLGDGAASGESGGSALFELHRNRAAQHSQEGAGAARDEDQRDGRNRENRIATIPECLRFAWSQDVDTVVSGAETVQQLEENVAVLKTFKKMTPEEIASLLARTKAKGLYGSKIEQYKKKEA